MSDDIEANGGNASDTICEGYYQSYIYDTI